MLTRSGLTALMDMRESIQSPCSPKGGSRIWRALSSQPDTFCDNIRNRIASLLTFTELGRVFDINPTLNPFELFLECTWLGQGSEDAGAHLGQIARLLELSPASILMYTRETNTSFRIPGTKKNGIASLENRILHEKSSVSEDSWLIWESTGLSGLRTEPGPYYVTTGLVDLN